MEDKNNLENQINHYRIGFFDVLIIIALMSPGLRMIPGIPFSILQIIIFILLFSILLYCYSGRYHLIFYKSEILLFLYITAITLLNERVDFESIKHIVMFFLLIFSVQNYVSNVKNIKKVLYVIYTTTFLISVIGIIQQIGFFIGIESLYDLSKYGVALESDAFVPYTRLGLLRVTSVYSEPAHLSSILSFSIVLMMISYLMQIKLFRMRKSWNVIIVICALMTFSSIVFISILICAIYILIQKKVKITRRNRMLLYGACFAPVVFFLLIDGKMLSHLKTIVNPSSENSTDLSGFAIISNLKIAMGKIKDGFIFGTGLNSHRLYYYDYIHNYYKEVYMYLNDTDAGSLYIRICSEFGIIGLALLGRYLLKEFFLIGKKSIKNMDLYYVQRIVLIGLAITGLRYASYISPFLALMFTMSIYINVEYRKKVKEDYRYHV